MAKWSGVKWCALIIIHMTNISLILATARFTRYPPSVLYVSRGETARFVWNYHVDNRREKFTSESPRWSFIDQNDSESIIGVDDKYTNNWDFVIKNETCPPRLLNPDRVSRDLPATLVITNVTTADNGMYKCSLMLKAGNPKDDQVHLVVTVPPKFIPNYHEQTYRITEGDNLEINCTAIGPPTPNITWVNITDGSIKSQGSGSAPLSINNTQRYHAGVYECQAKNNPNEDATQRRTNVIVYYPPEINKTATLDVLGCIGREVRLFCKASGSPKPSMKWIDPNDKEIFINVSSPLFKLKDSSDFGNYTCTVNNRLGNNSYVITLTEGACTTPTPKTNSISDVPAGIIAGVVIAGILAIAGLIIALIFCYRRKSLDRDSFRSGAQQERTVQMSSLRNQEEQYASVQHQQDRGSSTEPIPQYAVVDKNKKKKQNPDGLIYADLDLDSMDNLERRPSSGGHPTLEAGSTVYADITGDKKHHPEPQYGNLQAKDFSI